MRPGPPPTPTNLRLLRGNPGRRPINKNEPRPKPKTKAPPVPKGLGSDGKREWKRLAKELVSLGLLTNVDITAFRIYCDAYETYKDARRNIKLYGSILPSPNGFLMTSPYVHLANKSMSQMVKLMQEFGMTPSARTRVEVEGKSSDEDEVKEFLFGTGNNR